MICTIHGPDRAACREARNGVMCDWRRGVARPQTPHERLMEAAEKVRYAATGVEWTSTSCERMGLAHA